MHANVDLACRCFFIVAGVEKVVLIPGEHDERGPVMFAWRLPFKYRDNMERIKALACFSFRAA